jgi:hypothetical protein
MDVTRVVAAQAMTRVSEFAPGFPVDDAQARPDLMSKRADAR